MSRNRIRLIAAALSLLVLAGLALGARCMSLTSVTCSPATLFGNAPELDVPYAGTRPEVVARMLTMAAVNRDDYVIDLGTGDGRILIAAARDHGARGLGVDLDPVLVDRAEQNARDEGVADRARFLVQDLFDTPLGQADVVTMFLLPEVNLRLRPRILSEMRPGSRVVSHAFDMGEWAPSARDRVGGSTIYLWTVPARVGGRWSVSLPDGQAADLTLDQRFDVATGVLRQGGQQLRVEGQLDGPRVVLRSGRLTLVGTVTGGRINGEGWSALRRP